MNFDIEHLEFLSKLKFQEDERKTFENEFEGILEFVSDISEVEIPENLEEDKPISISDLREDEIVESSPREEILANAPKEKDGCFRTPLVVE